MDSFESFFRDELDYLQQLAELQAEDRPHLADFLPNSRDPDVARLAQGFAFLTAALRQKITDGFPEITQNMLSVLWPFPLRPLPSTTIIQLMPKKKHLAIVDDIAKGSVIASHHGIEFKTCRDLHTEPLTLLSKKLSVGSDNSLIELTFRYHGGMDNWYPQPFQLYLGNNQQVAAQLRLWLDQYQSKSYLLYKEHPVRAYQDVVFTQGYGANKLAIPHEKDDYWSAQLLPEYYYLPHVNDFISIDLRREFSTLSLPQDGIFTLQLVFDGMIPLTQQDIEQSFVLNCVPAINLTQKTTDQIVFNADRDRYDIPVVQEQIFKILSVYTYTEPDSEEQGERHVFTPVTERHHHNKFDDLDTLYYEVIIGKNAFDRVQYQIRFYDADFKPLTRPHYMNFVCDYLALHNEADTLAVNDICIPGIDITSNWAAQNITQTTPDYPAITSSHVHWQLLNQLSFNPVWFNNLQAVKSTLQEFILHSESHVPLARKLQHQIDGLSAIQCKPVDRLFGGQMRRGYQLDLVIDGTHFANLGNAYTFVGILVHFFLFAVSENHFLMANINVSGTDTVWYLPEIFGHRKMM